MSAVKCLQDLPVEVLEIIFGFLALDDRKLVSQVCRLWESLSFSTKLLKNVVLAIRFDGSSEGVKCHQIFENSFRNYSHISCHYWEDEHEVVPSIVNKFKNSLKTLTITGEHNIEITMSTEYIKKLFNCLSELQELRILSMISISDHDETKDIKIVQLPKLSALKTLFLCHCSLEAGCIDWPHIAPNLQNFYVPHNNTHFFYNLINFYSQQLCKLGVPTDFSDQFFEGFDETTFPRVQSLTITGWRQPATIRFETFFQRFSNLTELNYGFTMTSEDLSFIVKYFPTLATVRLFDDVPTDVFSILSKLPLLQRLALVQSTIEGQPFASSNSFPKLTHLDLKHVDIEEPEQFYQQLVHKMPQLTRFGSANCGDSLLSSYICDNVRNLNRLSIDWDNVGLEDDSFSKLHQLEKLTHLRLSCDYCYRKTFSWSMFPRCPSIRKLEIHVAKLAIFFTMEEDTREWQCLASSFPSLSQLKIQKCNPPLTERQVDQLKMLMPQCRIQIVPRITLFDFDTDDGCLQPEMCLAA